MGWYTEEIYVVETSRWFSKFYAKLGTARNMRTRLSRRRAQGYDTRTPRVLKGTVTWEEVPDDIDRNNIPCPTENTNTGCPIVNCTMRHAVGRLF